MPLDGQYSLSVELIRLVPLVLTAAGRSYEAAMSLARDLQSSGSDIVVEEDLTGILGRSSIADSIASSFRTVMSTPDPPQQLADGVTLMRGPGPTVRRALTEKPYFSTIVQCSFLVHMHEKASLAAALSAYFNDISQKGLGHLPSRTVPSANSIRGMLQAVEDQTVLYDWRKQLLAVAAALDVDESTTHESFPRVVLHGLMSMTPIAQHFPEDRYIVIETMAGVCGIVAWCYVMMGLRVLIRFSGNGTGREVRFPPDDSIAEQVFVEVHLPAQDSRLAQEHAQHEASITLLSVSPKEELFKLKTDPDSDNISSTFKGPVKGLARRIFEKITPKRTGRKKILDEMKFIVASFALRIAKNLRREPYGGNRSQDQLDDEVYDSNLHDYGPLDVEALRDNIEPGVLLGTCQLLFSASDESFPHKKVEEYVALHEGLDFPDLKRQPPTSLEPILREWKNHERETIWKELVDALTLLVVVILAFTHVTNLESCRDFLLSESLSVLSKSALCCNLFIWDGTDRVNAKPADWMEIIGLLMVGHREAADLDLGDTCLLSDKGWSIYTNTFGDSDPSYIDPGYVTLERGVPCRNGVWRHRVIDGPRRANRSVVWHEESVSGKRAILRCAVPVKRGEPMIGERGDSLMVTLRLYSQPIHGAKISDLSEVRRTGYNELWTAMYTVEKTSPCNHPKRSQEEVILEPGCATIVGFADYNRVSKDSEDLEIYQSPWTGVKIYLTTGNTAARWRALISIWSSHGGYTYYRTVLRDDRCCMKCAVVQATQQTGAWYVVL